MSRLRVVHICDHLGWQGSRMHGVKRLFAWMIPRFDRQRYEVSLVSLRGRDVSEDTLEQHGIDVTYLGRHKFDPRTYPHLLAVLRDKRADLLHMHGYGATTFGRLCARRLQIPAVLHEHANHGDTPWFQKVADTLLAPYTDLALAVSASTAEFDECARERSDEERAALRAALGIAPSTVAVGTVTRLMPSKGNQYLVEAARALTDRHPDVRVYIAGEGELERDLRERMFAWLVSTQVERR